MKALTLWQPWASLVAAGAKRIETRSWQASYRGPLLIHASSKWDAGLCRIAYGGPFRLALGLAGDVADHLDRFGDSLRRGARPPLPVGAAVAVATLAGCWAASYWDRRRVLRSGEDVLFLDPAEIAFGDYTPGRFGWILGDVRPLPTPIACPGARGLWTVPEDLERRVLAALADSPGMPSGKGGAPCAT